MLCPRCHRDEVCYSTPILPKKHYPKSGSFVELCAGCKCEWVRLSSVGERQHSHSYFVRFFSWLRGGSGELRHLPEVQEKAEID